MWQEDAWLLEPFLSIKFMRKIINYIIWLLSLWLFCSNSAQYCLPVPPEEIWKLLRTDFQGNKLASLVLYLEQKTGQALLRLLLLQDNRN